jgi:purine-binding chemotaxis protein CheW
MERQIVVFELAQEHFGVEISAVESIIKMQTITRMPHSPEFIEGVTNLRGKVLPVVHLRKRFGLADQEATRNSRIVVVNIGNTEVGMIVDAVSEVLTVSESAVEPVPTLTTTVNSTFITSIVKMDDYLVILLDLRKVLSNQEQDQMQFSMA